MTYTLLQSGFDCAAGDQQAEWGSQEMLLDMGSIKAMSSGVGGVLRMCRCRLLLLTQNNYSIGHGL